MKKYKIKYKIEKGSFKKEDTASGEWGATDAIGIVSILETKAKDTSTVFAGWDGRMNKPLDDLEWFKAWCVLTKHLSDSKTLSKAKKEFCKNVFEIIKTALREGGEVK